eukprot:1156055-Pelagomonas_calceolata.AAC.2
MAGHIWLRHICARVAQNGYGTSEQVWEERKEQTTQSKSGHMHQGKVTCPDSCPTTKTNYPKLCDYLPSNIMLLIMDDPRPFFCCTCPRTLQCPIRASATKRFGTQELPLLQKQGMQVRVCNRRRMLKLLCRKETPAGSLRSQKDMQVQPVVNKAVVRSNTVFSDCEDMRPGAQLEASQQQHSELCKQLQGEEITLHTILLGVCGNT